MEMPRLDVLCQAEGFSGRERETGEWPPRRGVETPDEIIGPEKGAEPVGVQGHDQVEGEQTQDDGVENSENGGKQNLSGPAWV